MKLDLHSHSYYSDGAHSPQFVLERAGANGITQLALTDHDCIDGVLELQKISLPTGFKLIDGVEISAFWDNQEVHIVGLGIDTANQQLRSLLRAQQEKRWRRMELIQQEMIKTGLNGLMGYLENCHCVAPTRSHVAQFLIQQGKASSIKKAFKSLSKKGCYFIAAQWCSMAEAISAINQSDGFAVLAHPHRYPFNNRRLKSLIAEFKSVGGEAMEVCYSNITDEDSNFLGKLCTEAGLLASQGSDFHDASATWKDLGRVKALPKVCNNNAIWLAPKWRY
jgi:predicted metal-dependent phosphoesterase TrpH